MFERDWYTTCLCSFSPWAAQKSKFSKLISNHLKQPSKIFRACFRPYLCAFHPIWVLSAGGGGGVQTGVVHNLLMHFFQPLQLKN